VEGIDHAVDAFLALFSGKKLREDGVKLTNSCLTPFHLGDKKRPGLTQRHPDELESTTVLIHLPNMDHFDVSFAWQNCGASISLRPVLELNPAAPDWS